MRDGQRLDESPVRLPPTVNPIIIGIFFYFPDLVTPGRTCQELLRGVPALFSRALAYQDLTPSRAERHSLLAGRLFDLRSSTYP